MGIFSGQARGFASALQSRPLRIAVVFTLDACIVALSLWIALLLRFDGTIVPEYWQPLPLYVSLLIAARFIANAVFRLHRWSFRLSGLRDGVRVVIAGFAGTCVYVLELYMIRAMPLPRSVVALELFLSTSAMAGLRFAPRLAWMYWTEISRVRRGDTVRTLIVGGGAAGEMLFRDLQRSGEHQYQVVGFLDDDRTKWGNIILGRPVLGGLGDLPSVVEHHHVSNVLIAIPRLPSNKVRQLLSLCSGLKVQIKILPVSFVYFQDRGAVSMLQDLSPEDLLPREPVIFGDAERLAIRGRRVLVTGAAGTIGSEICRQLLEASVGELIAVDINENKLYLLEHELKRRHPDAKFVALIADIRDEGRVRLILQQYRPQDVFHAAAHKHVPLMEASPCEAVKNNVIGTSHVLRAAENVPVESFVFISTDKAVMPTSVMGVTKRVGEMMARDVTRRSGLHCCVVRFGNVLGSDGSVVPLFRQQIAAGGPVTITDPDAQRYFMITSEAVGLVVKAAYQRGGDLCVLDMGDPIRIMDLARHLITMVGLVPDVDIPIVVTGLRQGEKLTEEVLTEEEERTHQVDGKIRVVQGVPPAADLWQRVAELRDAAHAEDAERVLTLLRYIVPSYRPSAPAGPGAPSVRRIASS